MKKKHTKIFLPEILFIDFCVGNCGSGGAVWGGGLKMCLLGVYHIQGVWFYMMVWYVYRATFEPYTGVSLMKQTFIFYGIFFPEKKKQKKNILTLFYCQCCKYQGMKSWMKYSMIMTNIPKMIFPKNKTFNFFHLFHPPWHTKYTFIIV